MAEDYEDVDYEDSWYDSYEKWQTNTSNASDKYTSGVEAFADSISDNVDGVDNIDEDDVDTEAFENAVSNKSEEEWGEASRDKEEWGRRWHAGVQDE